MDLQWTFSVLLHGFTMEFAELEKQQEAKTDEGYAKTECWRNCRDHQDQHCLEVRPHW